MAQRPAMPSDVKGSGRIGGGTIAILLLTYSIIIAVVGHYAAPLALLTLSLPGAFYESSGISSWITLSVMIVVTAAFVVGIRSRVDHIHRRTVLALTLLLVAIVIVVAVGQYDTYLHSAWIASVTSIPFVAAATYVLFKIAGKRKRVLN